MSSECNYADIQCRLVEWTADQFRRRRFEKAVIGISGGIDSAVVCKLAVEALGTSNVYGYYLPYRTSSPDSARDAAVLADSAGISLETIDITPQTDAYFSRFEDACRRRRGNRMARERMIVLYDMSFMRKALVVGSSNRTEILLGYGTLHGDCAWAMSPIACLYKTQVKALALHMNIPESIIKKAPTADLWEGQTDEGEMGVSYSDADKLLYSWIDLKRGAGTPLNGVDSRALQRVFDMYSGSRFKREAGAVPDFRFPMYQEGTIS